jgi:hemerythrin-like metal-binding protein
MKWSDQYATGNQQVDDQHKMIFKMAEDYRAALDEGMGERVYGDMLRSLDVYVRTHFGYEEKCMDKYACPVADGNKKAHDRFVEVLAGFQQRYATGGFSPTDARELVDTLDAWLADHICRIDVRLKDYVEKS